MFLKPPPGIETGVKPFTRTSALLIVLVLLTPFALYFSTVESIVSVWNSSETFAHGYVILPISLWLIWRRRANFAALPPSPWWPALLLLALLGAGWLAARMGEVQVVMQYSYVAMLPVIALALLGPRLAASLAFPLLFMLFAVPFGEVFVGPLIAFTADFTVAAVQATGIPVLRTGTHFELPTGNWSVVEACSGVRYLISSVTLGSLYAYLTYRSVYRRALFVALSVVVPVLANGLRAFMIVMIGHHSGMTMATGVDHLIYGWLFFGVVMFLMFWIGSYFREDNDPVLPAAPAQNAARAAAAPRRMAAMAAAVVALAALWPAFAAWNDRANHNPAPVQLAQVAVAWPAAPAFANWSAHYMAPDAGFAGAWVAPGTSRPVRLALLYYRNQDKKKSLISSLNRMAPYDGAWHETAVTLRTEPAGARSLALRESVMQGPGGPLLVWHWMWVDGHYTTSNIIGKLRQAQGKLLLHGDDGALVTLTAPYEDNPEPARSALRAFLAAHGGAIDAALVSTSKGH